MPNKDEMRDEDKMIQKLEEHRDLTILAEKIGELEGIKVTPTKGNSSNGDFKYKEEDEEKLIEAFDKHLASHKVDYSNLDD